MPTSAGFAGNVEAAWLLGGRRGPEEVGSLHRQIEVIANVDLTLTGRVRGLTFAMASQSRRLRTDER